MTDEVRPGLAAALAAVQRNLPDVRKGLTAHVRSDKGNYSYKYADLADITKAVLPLLGENGLAWTTRPTIAGERLVLVYELLHVSGEKITGEYPLPASVSPQALGSAITYGRRYCLCAVTGVAADSDDDGAAASVQHERHDEQADRAQWDQTRRTVIANATAAIDEAETAEALDEVAKRTVEVEKKGLITGDDAIALRQKLVLKHDDVTGMAKQEDPE